MPARLVALIPVAAALLACDPPRGNRCATAEDCASSAEACDTALGTCVWKPCTRSDECGAPARCDLIRGHCLGAGAGLYQSLELTAPLADSEWNGELEVKAELKVKPGGERRDPDAIELRVSAPGGAMLPAVPLKRIGDGLYAARWLAPSEGDYSLTAHSEEMVLTSAPVKIRVDRTPPRFTVELPLPPAREVSDSLSAVDPVVEFARAWHRDELLTVRVRTDDPDVAFETVKVSMQGVGAESRPGAVTEAAPVAQTSSCGEKYCGRAEVDLSAPELKAFRGTFTVRVVGKDRAGNLGEAELGVPVTRWRWSYDAKNPLRATPAIGSKGTVYVGTAFGADSLHAVQPDGSRRWKAPFAAGVIIGSPAVGVTDGGDAIFVAGRGATATRLYALDAEGQVTDSCSAAAVAADASLALASWSGKLTAVAVMNRAFSATDGPGLAALQRGVTGLDGRCVTAPSGQAAFPANVVVRGNEVFYGTASGNVVAYAWADGSWTKKFWVSLAPQTARGLALVGDRIVGGAGAGVGLGSLFRLSTAGGAPGYFPTGTTQAPAWSAAVSAAGEVFYGQDGNDGVFPPQQPRLLKASMDGDSALASAETHGVAKGAPALGKGGLLYSATLGGELTALDAVLNAQWSLTGLGEVEASPALDCRRGPDGAPVAGARTGVLYLAAGNGKLYSVVVDSPGIDPTAPWPKYQRDPRNSGNADVALSELACP
jgi:hypothetical protein